MINPKATEEQIEQNYKQINEYQKEALKKINKLVREQKKEIEELIKEKNRAFKTLQYIKETFTYIDYRYLSKKSIENNIKRVIDRIELLEE